MSTAKWATPGSATSLTLSSVNSLANGSSSGLMTYDNSTALDLYASVAVSLGSLTPTSGGSITLRVYSAQGATAPDDIGALGGGDAYAVPLTTTTGAKVAIVPMVRLYPESMRFQITNNAGVALAAASNAISVRPFNESVA